jgi:hypothetical protein
MNSRMRFKELAGELVRVTSRLGITHRDDPAPGYIAHASGGFWDSALAERLIEICRELVELASSDGERNAARYRLAGQLQSILRLDEAAKECEELIRSRPNRAYADQQLLAYVEARRGNWERANELAQAVNDNAQASAFRISPLDLQREFEAGKRDREKQL